MKKLALVVILALAAIALTLIGVKTYKEAATNQHTLLVKVSSLLDKHEVCQEKPVERQDWIKNLNQDVEVCNGVGIPHYMVEIPTGQVTVYDLKTHEEYEIFFDEGKIRHIIKHRTGESFSTVKY